MLFYQYNACLDCRNRHERECWVNFPAAVNLAEILTIPERVAILEDNLKPITSVPEWDKRQWNYVQQLKAQTLHLNKQVNILLKKRDDEKLSF